MQTEMRAWVGCLACYNNGSLRGDWYDAETAGDVAPEALHGGETDHEELWCMDFEGFPAGQEECSPCEAQELAEKLGAVKHPEAFAAWVANGSGTIDDGREFEDSYCGEYTSEEDYAQELADETGALKDGAQWPYSCIDWEAAARELFCGDYWSASVTGERRVYVFRSQ
jgi:antirestriction protein